MTAPVTTARPRVTADARARVACVAVLGLAVISAMATSSGAASGSKQGSPDAARIAALARSELLQRLHQVRPDLGRIELTVIGPADSSSLRGTAASIPANAVQSSVLSAHMCVWVKLRRASGSVGSVPVWFSVQAFRSVLVTQRSRSAREVIGADELTVEERDVAPFSDIPLAVDSNLARMRMRRAVITGHVLLKGDIEETPPVLRGQEVAVEVKHGTVAIETRAVALREARLGESVKLQNPTSHETYVAQVVGEGRAEVVDR
jgi:flagella basal body P-ring formation protein FlgA